MAKAPPMFSKAPKPALAKPAKGKPFGAKKPPMAGPMQQKAARKARLAGMKL